MRSTTQRRLLRSFSWGPENLHRENRCLRVISELLFVHDNSQALRAGAPVRRCQSPTSASRVAAADLSRRCRSHWHQRRSNGGRSRVEILSGGVECDWHTNQPSGMASAPLTSPEAPSERQQTRASSA